MKWSEQELERAAWAIHTILKSGSGELITSQRGDTLLVQNDTGRTFKVVPELMEYMTDHGFIEPNNAPTH